MTFAIQGPMDRPEVVVNPLSMLAPGIFREIFQMTNPNPKVQRRDETPSPAAEENVRASSTTMAAPPGQRAEETAGCGRPTRSTGGRRRSRTSPPRRNSAAPRLASPQTGFKSTCFFLPSDSLMTPPATTSARVSRAFSSAIGASLTLKPPP